MHNADCDFLWDVNAENIVIVGLGEVHFARFYASTARVALTSQRVHCQIQATERFGEPATHCGFGKCGSGLLRGECGRCGGRRRGGGSGVDEGNVDGEDVLKARYDGFAGGFEYDALLDHQAGLLEVARSTLLHGLVDSLNVGVERVQDGAD